MSVQRNDLIPLLSDSVRTIFSMQFNLHISHCEKIVETQGYTVGLSISFKDHPLKVLLWIDKELLRKLTSILLMEDEFDSSDLQDVALELLNMVVGKAKMTASDRHISFTMQTPDWIGEEKMKRFSPSPDGGTLLFQVDGDCMVLDVKDENGQ